MLAPEPWRDPDLRRPRAGGPRRARGGARHAAARAAGGRRGGRGHKGARARGRGGHAGPRPGVPEAAHARARLQRCAAGARLRRAPAGPRAGGPRQQDAARAKASLDGGGSGSDVAAAPQCSPAAPTCGAGAANRCGGCSCRPQPCFSQGSLVPRHACRCAACCFRHAGRWDSSACERRGCDQWRACRARPLGR